MNNYKDGKIAVFFERKKGDGISRPSVLLL